MVTINGITPSQYRAAWRQSQAKSPAKNSFGSMLTDAQKAELAAMEKADRENPPLPPNQHWLYESPWLQLWGTYCAWREEHPPQVLPDTQGLTDKNLAYLQERYAGPLSWNQRMEILETLENLGVINREDADNALGLESGFTAIDIKHPRVIIGDRGNYWTDQWERIYEDSPACKFDSFDDVLAWLDSLSPK